jgi:hypothetical protein
MNSSPSTSLHYARFVEPIMEFYPTTWNNVPEIEVTAQRASNSKRRVLHLRRRGAVCPNISLSAEQESHDASEKE